MTHKSKVSGGLLISFWYVANSTRDAVLYKHVAHVEWDTASERRQFRGKIGFDSFQSTQRAFNVTVHSEQNWTKTESMI